ncbi:MAG: efflux transporter outer membrane subunit [Rubrivivax sp.]|nr:efflux transporter outer membrane subunit [Rubrivivax sp.]
MARPSLLAGSSIAAAVVLAGCALAPAYERPAAPVAPQWPLDAATAPAAGTPAPALPWADFFTDARQRALITLALEHNRDLRIATLNVEQARALAGVQRADRLPGLSAGITVDRGSAGSLYSVGLAMPSFELDLFGRVRSLSEAAQARYFASDEGRRAAQVALIAAVAGADLALRADDELLQLTQRTLAAREEQLRLVRVRLDAGAAAEPELRAVESLVAAARASLAALQRQRAQDLNALVLLLGRPLPADLPAAAPLAALSLAALPAGVPSTVLLERPDVRQAEQALVAANANIGAARAAFFPRIALTASLGTASTELSGLFSTTAWSFTGQLLQPLFDAGRNQAHLEASEAARAIAVAQYERTIQVAFREVADALAGRATLSEQLAAQRAQAEAEARRVELAEALLRGGVASQLERLDAERSLLAARQAELQLLLAEKLNAVLVYRVLGGGAGPARADAQAAGAAASGATLSR